MKVLIVGAGIGGLTLAAFLEGSNIEYEIWEKANDWQHQGYLIGLWNNGRRILEKLGLAEKFDTAGMRAQYYSIRNGAGHVLRNYNLAHFYASYGTALTLIDRTELHEWLLSKIDASKIRMGVSIKDIKTGKNILVIRTDGAEKEYDVVIGADGVNSIVRSLAFKDSVVSYTNWRAWWTWIDNAYNTPTAVAEYIEPGELVVVCSARGRTCATFIAPVDHTIWDDLEGRLQRLRTTFNNESALIPGSLADLNSENVQPTDFIEVELKEWVKGRVALLGDAAHSSGPHAGIGGSMAMEDAYVLAGELIKCADTNSVNHSLREYERKREPRIRSARKLSHKMKMWTLIKSRSLRRVVNLFVPYVPDRFFIRDYDRLLREEI